MSTDDAIRKTLIFSAILILVGSWGCMVGVVRGDVPSIVMASVGVACGVLLAVLALRARRKSRS